MYDSNVKGTCTAKTLNNNNNNNNKNKNKNNNNNNNQKKTKNITSSLLLPELSTTPSSAHPPHPPPPGSGGLPLRITQGCPAMFLRRFDAQHGVVRHRGAEEPARPSRGQEAAVPDAHLTPTTGGGWLGRRWLTRGGAVSVVERVFLGGWMVDGGGDVKEGGCGG